MKLPRLMFAAPKSGGGKTTVTCGFLEAARRAGREPAALKCGPDYIDPMFHRFVSGIPGGNLDSFFLDKDSLRQLLWRTVAGRELAVIEGVMGYYDGLGGNSMAASSFETACFTDTPVVLVVDAKGASVSLAALVKGFVEYQRDSRIRGVILNRLSPGMYGRMETLLNGLGIRVFGYLPEDPVFCLESRRLGLCLPGEVEALRDKIGALAERMAQTVDLDGLFSLSEEAPDLPGIYPSPAVQGEHPRIRIGIARDEAFCFYYQENLRLLEQMGAELLEFSPLWDKALPEGIEGMILGGGYPELYAKKLANNQRMREAVRGFCLAGRPVLAECGGFLYLHRELEGEDGEWYPMASVIDARGFRTGRLNRFGYLLLEGPGGVKIKGHEFHYWESSDPGAGWMAVKPSGGTRFPCIHQRGGFIAGFPHLYYPSNPDFIGKWLSFAREGRGSEER